jgi:hypothetical protein
VGGTGQGAAAPLEGSRRPDAKQAPALTEQQLIDLALVAMEAGDNRALDIGKLMDLIGRTVNEPQGHQEFFIPRGARPHLHFVKGILLHTSSGGHHTCLYRDGQLHLGALRRLNQDAGRPGSGMASPVVREFLGALIAFAGP